MTQTFTMYNLAIQCILKAGYSEWVLVDLGSESRIELRHTPVFKITGARKHVYRTK